jgi:tellurite resistance protein TerC
MCRGPHVPRQSTPLLAASTWAFLAGSLAPAVLLMDRGPMDVPLWLWGAVVLAIVVMLGLDLFVFHRDAHAVSAREAALASALWIAIAVAFGGVVWLIAGGERAGEYFAGYLIEKSLSVDNIFVFSLLLGYFAVPPADQHRVLFWGVVGALLMRAAFIAAGASLLQRFDWAIYAFGALLLATGLNMALHRKSEVHPERNPILRLLRRVVPMTEDYAGHRFFVRQPDPAGGRRLAATPLLAALIAIETTDLVFAVDSIPAIFGVTNEPFLVFTSNAFAILGLRALYFLLAGLMGRFAHLKTGLAVILMFVGAKMGLSGVYHIPIGASLAVIAGILIVAVCASLIGERPNALGGSHSK